MSRGRKPKSSAINDEKSIYYDHLGSYFECIVKEIGSFYVGNKTLSTDSAHELLESIRKKKGKVVSKLGKIEFREIPFSIPSNWVWCRLGDIIELSENRNIEVELPSKTLINYVDIDAIDNKRFCIREVKQKTVKELSSRARRVLKKGFIMYSLVRPYLNNIAIIEEDKENFIGSTGFAVFNGIEIENEFLKLWLLSDFVRGQYLKYLSGFNSPGITSDQFLSTLVPLAPVSEQLTIMKFLKRIESSDLTEETNFFNNKIELKVRSLHKAQFDGSNLHTELTYQLDLVKQLRQAFLREAMQGKLVPQDVNDEPASVLLQKIKVEKAQLIKEGKLKKEKELPPIKPEEIPFEIPKNWVWCRLGEICNYGSSPKAEPKSLNRDTWVLDLEDIEKETSKLLVKVRFSERDSLSTKNVFKKGEVLYSKLRPYLDKVIVADENGVCTTEILPLMLYGNLNPYFIRYSLKRSDFLGYVNSVTKGMKMPRLGTPEGRKALIPLPPLSEQHRIVAKLEQLMRHCNELEQTIKQSQTQNEQLLQQVLREALRTKDKEYRIKDKMSLAVQNLSNIK